MEIRSLGRDKLFVSEKDSVSGQIVQSASVQYDSASGKTIVTNLTTGAVAQSDDAAIGAVLGALAVVGIVCVGAMTLILAKIVSGES